MADVKGTYCVVLIIHRMGAERGGPQGALQHFQALFIRTLLFHTCIFHPCTIAL